jgi:paraquat-inducible protein B
VTGIFVNFDPSDISINIPVRFETDPDRFRTIGPRAISDDAELHRALVSQGLRAQLQLQSLVTGQLMINMDFFPETPVKMFGIENAGLGVDVKPWWEIPTISTTLQDLEKALGEIDFKDITHDVKRAMDGIAKLATSPDLHESIRILKDMLTDIQQLAHHLDSKVEPLATSFDQTLVEARAGIGDARKLMNEQAPALVSKIKKAAESATTALDQANLTLKSIEGVAEEGTQLRYEVSAALREISAAARSVRVLSDFIEQHPDALLRGRATRTGGN